MPAKRFLAVVLVLGGAVSAQAQWSNSLFDKTSHDFGYVARGAHVTTQFKITNRQNRNLHIVSAQPSCSICSVASLSQRYLKPGESTILTAGMKTIGFTGPRSVSVNVTFDQPYYGQTRLTLRCNSRTDVVINPGEIQFGTVKRGKEEVKEVKIEFAGNRDWKISSATCPHESVDVSLKETHRNPAQRGRHHEIGYLLSVKLKPDAHPGILSSKVTLGINDAYNKTLDIMLQGSVQADVSVSPSTLTFADSEQSQRVFVRGVREFRILDIQTEGGAFSMEKPTTARKVHILEVKRVGDPAPGLARQAFEIKTDLDPVPLRLEVLIPQPAPVGP